MQLKLNKAKVGHLLELLEANEREGAYYGNKKHYEKRHNELKADLELLIKPKVSHCVCSSPVAKKSMFFIKEYCNLCGKDIK
jgi:hypothetical protein